MRVAVNYDDVLDQLRSADLLVEDIETGRTVRCPIKGDREKRGWYRLHDLPLPSGDVLIVGTFGIWRGDDPGTLKVDLKKRDSALTDDQRDALRRRLADDRKREKAQRERRAERAAERAAAAWLRYEPSGDCEYLRRKRVADYGLRFTSHGAAVVPLLDGAGKIHGLQFLRTPAQAETAKRPVKEFWPAGLAKLGHFHLLGSPSWIVLVAEGYATAATLHMTTGHPVAVAFDAGNLVHVARALRARYPRIRVLICADDDILQKCRECQTRLVLTEHPETCPNCGKPHRAENAGVAGASAAALEVNGAWLAPKFSDAIEAKRRAQFIEHGTKLTDFNDLQAQEGIHAVREQVAAHLSALRWAMPMQNADTTGTGDGGAQLRPIESIDDLLARYVLIYAQGSMVFDRDEHILLSISDMRDVCINRYIHRAWSESPRRAIERIDSVDFDPSCTKPGITCNLWAGWPTKPKPGRCEKLLELLRHMCAAESGKSAEDLYQWVLRWLAYPLQHPGAKLKSTIVVHGPQGTGKNMFFEAYMAIYGRYGRMLDQDALEDKFNDWASRKLFLIADEVVARAELYKLKNKLKTLITGAKIRINPKNMAAYEEDNHVNLVFLSNEEMPVVLEEDDRRHAVIWTPRSLSQAFYQEVLDEIRAGGSEALHDYLLNLDLGDFTEGTRPPTTSAKDRLVALGVDSPVGFYDALILDDIIGLKFASALSADWYEAYKVWCHRTGARAAPLPKFVNKLERKRGVSCERKRYRIEQTTHGPHGMLLLSGLPDTSNQSEADALGECVVRMRTQLEDYRGRT